MVNPPEVVSEVQSSQLPRSASLESGHSNHETIPAGTPSEAPLIPHDDSLLVSVQDHNGEHQPLPEQASDHLQPCESGPTPSSDHSSGPTEAGTELTDLPAEPDLAGSQSQPSKTIRTRPRSRPASAFWHSLTHLQSFLIDTWWPEALGLAFSSACLIAIAGLLASYQGHKIPDYHNGLTLNAIISTLAVASKSALIFAVAATLSQSKWCWFHTPARDQHRRLQDMQLVEDATRGPLGSLTMLLTRTILSLGSIGAVIVVLALAYEPFVQQVIGYPVRASNISSEATLRRAIAVPYWDMNVPPAATDAVYSGIYAARSSFQRAPFCPTGNCTWAPFQSTEWCSKCEDVSEQLHTGDCNFTIGELIDEVQKTNSSDRNCTFSLSAGKKVAVHFSAFYFPSDVNEAQLTLTLWLPSITSLTGLGVDSSSAADVRRYLRDTYTIMGQLNPLVPFVYVTTKSELSTEGIKSSDTLPRLLRATACFLTPCLRTYNASISSGELHNQVIDEDYGVLSPFDWQDSTTDEDLVGLCWKPEALRHQKVSTSTLYGPADSSLAALLSYNIYTNPANMAWCNPIGDPRKWTDNILSPLAGGVQKQISLYMDRDANGGPVINKNTAVSVLGGDYYTPSAPNVQSPFLQKIFGNGSTSLMHTYIPGITDALTQKNLHFDTIYSTSSNPNFSNVSKIITLLPGTVWATKSSYTSGGAI